MPRIQIIIIVAVIANLIQAAAGIYLGTTMQECRNHMYTVHRQSLVVIVGQFHANIIIAL